MTVADFMEGTVDVPKLGKVKKAYVIVPVALVGAYVAYRWYAAGTADDTSTGDGSYTTDDLTDMGQSTGGGTQNVGGNNGNQNTDGTSDTVIDTNQEWTAAAVEALQNAGYDAMVVYGALGEFLARKALDKTEATIARAALAAAGQPPINGPYSVIEEATATSTTPAAPKNVRQWTAPQQTSLAIRWDSVTGAKSYQIFRSDTGNEPIGSSYDTTSYVRGLKPASTYKITVRALNSSGKAGPMSGAYTAKTLAVKLAAPVGLKASPIHKTSFRVSCKEVKGATYYRWYLNGTPYGASDDPFRDFTSLRSNTNYRVQVAADVTNQVPGPWSKPLTVKTKKA